MKTKTTLIAFAALTAAGAGAVAWKFSHGQGAHAAVTRADPPAPAVTIAPARTAEVVEAVAVTGTLTARGDIFAGPEIEGLRIVEILVEEGDRVARGAVLARLAREALDAQLAQSDAALARAEASIAQARSQIAQADANARLAAADAERAQTLLRTGSATQALVDQRKAAESAASAQAQAARDALRAAEAERKSLEAQRRELQVRISRTEVRTPAAGVVVRRAAKLGAVATAVGEPLFRIVEDGEIELEGEVPETRLGALKPGQPALVTLADGARVAGEVRLVSPEVDRASRLGRVRVKLAPNSVARVGAFARAEIEVRRDQSITAPASAVIYGPNGPSVLVAADGLVQARAVSLGLVDGTRAELRSGVREGEEIVVRAGAFLRPGDAVRPVHAGAGEPTR